MNEFESEVRRRTLAAQQFENQRRKEEQERQVTAAKQLPQSQSAAQDFQGAIQGRFKTAAEASAGAMQYSGPIPALDLSTAYDLAWVGPAPFRALRVSVDNSAGTISWTWRSDRTEHGRTSNDAGTFDSTFLDCLIFGLMDQETWFSGAAPAIK